MAARLTNIGLQMPCPSVVVWCDWMLMARNGSGARRSCMLQILDFKVGALFLFVAVSGVLVES